MAVKISGKIDVQGMIGKRIEAKHEALEVGMSNFLANMQLRLDRGQDWEGEPFNRYSKSWAEQRRGKKLETTRVNLRYGYDSKGRTRPAMRDSLQKLKAIITGSYYTARVGFSGTDPQAAKKAEGHEKEHGRKWFAMSDKERRLIKSRIDKA